MNWYSEISQIFLCPCVISITYCSSLPFLSLSDTLFFSLSLHSPHAHSLPFPHSFLSRSNELCDSHNTHTLNGGVLGELSEDDLSTVYKRLRTMSFHPSENDIDSLLHNCSCNCCSRRVSVSSFPLPSRQLIFDLLFFQIFSMAISILEKERNPGSFNSSLLWKYEGTK